MRLVTTETSSTQFRTTTATLCNAGDILRRSCSARAAAARHKRSRTDGGCAEDALVCAASVLVLVVVVIAEMLSLSLSVSLSSHAIAPPL